MEYIFIVLLVLILVAIAFLAVALFKRHASAAVTVETLRLEKEKEMAELRDQQRLQIEELKRQHHDNSEALRRETLAQFKAMAAEIARSNTDSLKASNTEQIQAILKPLTENIEGFRKAVSDTYVSENASRKSLSDQIDRLMKLNESIGTEARNLTSALKGNSKIQGDWGEMILQTMLENAGLEEGIHFQTQLSRDADGNTIRDDEGHLRRPDVVVMMPDSRRLIIDSKVSLTAFTEYCSTEDADLRRHFLKEHVQSVRRHIDELSGKAYQNIIKDSADHVMMFIPNEGAYIAAVQQDSELWNYAYSRRVAIVSPTHLFSVMRIVAQLWTQDKQNRNTLEIARKGGALYDKVVLYLQAMQDLGDALSRATTAYDTALSRLSTGKGNVIRTAEDLRTLGAKASKSIPDKYLDADCDTPQKLTDVSATLATQS